MRIFHQDDLAELNSWYAARGEAELPLTMLPEVGVFAPDMAAGFLYRTDAPGFALLDTFVSNPAAPLRARAMALRDIAERLIHLAEAGGVTHLMAICKSRGIQRLADRMGLRPVGLYVIAGKELS